MKKCFKENPLRWIPIWIALGAAIGFPINNIPIGVSIGTGIGFFLFLISYFKIKKKTLVN